MAKITAQTSGAADRLEGLVYREATARDLPALQLLEQKLIDSERPYDAFLKDRDAAYYDIRHLIADPDTFLLVVDSGGEIAGSGYGQIRVSDCFHQHDSHCYLGFIYVEPEFRGSGVAGRIVGKLKDWSISRNVRHFRLNVYSANEAAIRAYERAGFSKITVKMEVAVTD